MLYILGLRVGCRQAFNRSVLRPRQKMIDALTRILSITFVLDLKHSQCVCEPFRNHGVVGYLYDCTFFLFFLGFIKININAVVLTYPEFSQVYINKKKKNRMLIK
jgi:hypothetical protein